MKILVVSPYFSPYSGVGALRMNSFVRYLVDQKDDVTVAKIASEHYPNDMKNANEVLGINRIEIAYHKNAKEQERLFYHALDKILSKQNYDVILCSCGPFYTLAVMVKLNKQYNIPYVLDYRDLWILDDRQPTKLIMKLRKKFFILRYYLYEKKAVTKSKLFVTVTPACLVAMKKLYNLNEDKCGVVYNGYDDHLLKGIIQQNQKNNTEVIISIFGKFAYYSRESAFKYICAIKNLIDQGYNLKIIHIGTIEKEIENMMVEIDFPENVYHCTGNMEYTSGIEMLAQADICAAILNYSKGVGTKVFDYIFVNKPIVAMAPSGSDFEKLIMEYENAFVCQTQNEIEQCIEKIIRNKLHCLGTNVSFEKYSRTHQNEVYRSIILNSLNN